MERAEILLQQGREAASQRNYEAALSLLREASELAPDSAEPSYEIAVVYLISQQFQQALKYYQQADALAPEGFSNAKTAVWALEKEAAGIYPAGLYLAFAQHDWMKDPDRKIDLLRRITQKYPDFTPAWKELGSLLKDPDERLEMIEKGLSQSDIDIDTKGKLLLDKALVTQLKGDQSGAKRQLEALLKEKLTPSNRAMAEFVLSTIH